MASVRPDPQTGIYRIHFWYGGRQFQQSLKTTSEQKARTMKGQIEETLLDLERGRLILPSGADFWEFVKTDGKRDSKPVMQKGMTLVLQRYACRN